MTRLIDTTASALRASLAAIVRRTRDGGPVQSWLALAGADVPALQRANRRPTI